MSLPEAKGMARAAPAARIDPGGPVPSDGADAIFPGSPITPPRTEGVTWIVRRMPVRMSQGQIGR